jgi:hypothetical protein
MSAVDAVLAVATADVADAVRWLLAQGARVTYEEAPHGMGFAVLELELDHTQIRMVRDRGQWMLDLRSEGQPWLQLDLVHAARVGGVDWQQEGTRTGPLPDQLPVGVSWRDELPAALDWVRSTADAVGQTVAMGRARADQIFPKQ